jgi:LPXTG-motif cell wall-anchored protein
LARTGSASEQRALVGLGLMLLGIGVLVMTRPTRRAAPLRF